LFLFFSFFFVLFSLSLFCVFLPRDSGLSILDRPFDFI
jgi:hypothetical protein